MAVDLLSNPDLDLLTRENVSTSVREKFAAASSEEDVIHVIQSLDTSTIDALGARLDAAGEAVAAHKLRFGLATSPRRASWRSPTTIKLNPIRIAALICARPARTHRRIFEFVQNLNFQTCALLILARHTARARHTAHKSSPHGAGDAQRGNSATQRLCDSLVHDGE